MTIQLAADLGYGIPWLTEVLTIAIVLTTAFLVYVTLSTKSKHVALGGFDKAKYELHKYHAERYWGILFICSWYVNLALFFGYSLDATGRFFPSNSTPGEGAYN